MAIDHVVPFFALITCFGIVLSSVWHVRAKNWTIVIFGAWLFLWNFVLFLNSMIWWNDDDIDGAPVWCDISVKLTSMWVMGVPAASLCVTRKLESISSTRVVSATAKEKRNSLLIELFISIVVPILYAILSIVYQGHRFDIIGGIGCNPAVFVSWPYILLGVLPPPIVALISLGYAIASLRHFFIRRKQFAAVLCSTGSNLNKSRYIRMMALCVSEILLNIPLTITLQVLASQQYGDWFQPYISWSWVHYGFGTVLHVPSTIFDSPSTYKAFIVSEISRWLAPVSGAFLIIFFGFNSDAVEEYRQIYNFSKKKIKKIFVRKPQVSTLPRTEFSQNDNSLQVPPLTPQTDVSSTFEFKNEKEISHPIPFQDLNDLESSFPGTMNVHIRSERTTL